MDITAVFGELEKLIIPAFFGIAVGWATGMTTIWANRRQRTIDLADKLNQMMGEMVGQHQELQERHDALYEEMRQFRHDWDKQESEWRNKLADRDQVIYFLRHDLWLQKTKVERLQTDLQRAVNEEPSANPP